MLRAIGAVVAGLVVAVGIIMAVQVIGHKIWPAPEGLDWNDAEVIRTYTSQLPFLALLFPIISYFLGTLAGTYVACRISSAKPLALVGVVGLVLLAFTIANLISIPHPVWFSVTAVAAVIIGGWLSLQLAGRRQAQASS
ncbi:MAG: hypothetical protein QNJ23_04290 [Woeseiaceae bacterium]|nr:hypothetical protein [Woeseiaceae bacterium]